MSGGREEADGVAPRVLAKSKKKEIICVFIQTHQIVARREELGGERRNGDGQNAWEEKGKSGLAGRRGGGRMKADGTGFRPAGRARLLLLSYSNIT